MSEMKNPAVIVSLKEGGEFKCDLKVEERLVSNFIPFFEFFLDERRNAFGTLGF